MKAYPLVLMPATMLGNALLQEDKREENHSYSMTISRGVVTPWTNVTNSMVVQTQIGKVGNQGTSGLQIMFEKNKET